MFSQVYDPLHNILLSALMAAIPIIVFLGAIGWLELKAHIAALLGLAAALAVAIFTFGMPAKMAFLSAGYGAAFGLLPIGWIILNVIFLYQLTDTASNVLFGGLQKITAGQLGLDPVLMAAANSCGGVMGKMIDAQSIVVASTATRWYGHEADILRFVFIHSITLAVLVGVVVMIAAHA
jgi:lactate permease